VCGITGFLMRSDSRTEDELRGIAERMSCALRHRGPDDAGVWVDARTGIALGHRRLAILDLSPNGRQPMASADGRFQLLLNGEIYNEAVLRQELERDGQRFRGRSDTEVMLAAISCWGLARAVSNLNGMFAFALWDRHDRVLHLGRDRIGEKPLYYGWMRGTFLFASELKALRAHPDFDGDVDRDVLALYFRRNYVPAPHSIYKNVYKLPAGCLLSITPSSRQTGFSPFADAAGAACRPERYWSLREVTSRAAAKPFTGSSQEAVSSLESLLIDTVTLRMTADVSVGAFLSGGIDSSTVVALMQAGSRSPVKTFAIGSDDRAYDETAAASAVARHLGTDHVDVRATADDARRIIPTLPAMYDEPFADSSQIPTALVAQLARCDVKVALSGDGGDELFGGYMLYSWATRIWTMTGRMPHPLRLAAAAALRSVPAPAWNAAFSIGGVVFPAARRPMEPGDKLHRLAELLQATSPDALYDSLMSRWRRPSALVLSSSEPHSTPPEAAGVESRSFVQRMMYSDLMTYLPDDLLVKVDRATMAVGLEARMPLLDHRVVEFAARLPESMLIHGKRGKWILRQVLHRYVPASLVDRPKTGFSVPLSDWLRGPLREWAADLIDERRLREDGYLDADVVRKTWREHITERRNRSRELWEILMFQAWIAA